METKSSIIIADSSGLVSLINPTDANHAAAVACARYLGAANLPLLLPNEVVAETLNILGKKFGHKVAIQAGRNFLSGDGQFVPIETPPEVIQAALDRFTHVSESVSFTDCLVMTTAEHQLTRLVFGFDSAFRKNGFRLPGEDAIREEAT